MGLAEKILNRLPISKPQRKFLRILLTSLLVVPGKANFRNLSRYSGLSERTYARQFSNPFDFLTFNRHLIYEVFGAQSERIIAFDPTFIPKAGKHTFGRGFFWNGLKSRPEKGLEVSVVAVVDLFANQGLTLSVCQTLPSETSAASRRSSRSDSEADETLIDQYLAHLTRVRPCLAACERYVVIDGGLTRKKFIDGICHQDLHVIGKLRLDANMRYLYQGPKRPGRGRQKVYDGKVDWKDLGRLEFVGIQDEVALYSGLLNHVHFKRNLRVVLLLDGSIPDKPRYVLLFSTDVDLDPWTLVRYYKARFQEEFLFRDGKQFLGLGDCQARDQRRLDFHFNATLTALNLAKAEQINAQTDIHPRVCSVANVKTRYFNQHLLDRFISIFGLDPTWVKNHPAYSSLLDYGRIAS